MTPDGCRFTFGGSDATDFSVPYYSRESGDLIATSWHLSEIKTQDGRTVTYQYANGNDGNSYDLMVDIRYSPSVPDNKASRHRETTVSISDGADSPVFFFSPQDYAASQR